MKIDNSGINITQLANFIDNTFSIGGIETIRFIPKGEEGYVYFVKTEDGNNFLLKIQKPNEHIDYFLAAKSVSCLHYYHKLHYVVAPIQTLDRKNIVKYEDKWLSLFPFIKGKSLYETGDFKWELDRIAKMMADLHNAGIETFDQLPKEKFQNPFEKTIVKLLYVSEHHDANSNRYQHMTAELFLKQKTDIEATLAKMREMQKKLSGTSINLAITHGDANFANILRDNEANLYLVDWGEIGIAPVERDMLSFIEVDGKPLDFKRFLSSYLVNRPQTLLNHEVFEFYLYRWCLQEIADYGSRILLQDSGTEECKHSWIELHPYLPISHQYIRERVSEIRTILSSI